jgi:uncharacterized protein YndB with AHSA1/START domain
VTEPLSFSFEIGCPQAKAFELWTSRTSTWWPTDHSVSGEADLDVVFEGRVGGRVYERTRSGTEHEWGTVTRWDPPTRVAYTWHLRADRADATDVEVRFVADGEDRTRVEIDHRGWERLGAAADAGREGNRRGWEGVLPHFIGAIES